MTSTAEKLRTRRTALGKTQAEIARAADMSTVQYNGYENSRHEPSDDTMARLAKALKSKPADLWQDAEDDPDTIPGLIAALKRKFADENGFKANQISISIQVS